MKRITVEVEYINPLTRRWDWRPFRASIGRRSIELTREEMIDLAREIEHLLEAHPPTEA